MHSTTRTLASSMHARVLLVSVNNTQSHRQPTSTSPYPPQGKPDEYYSRVCILLVGRTHATSLERPQGIRQDRTRQPGRSPQETTLT